MTPGTAANRHIVCGIYDKTTDEILSFLICFTIATVTIAVAQSPPTKSAVMPESSFSKSKSLQQRLTVQASGYTRRIIQSRLLDVCESDARSPYH